MIKVLIDKNGDIASINSIEHKEVILDFDISDDIVVNPETGSFCKRADSIFHQEMIDKNKTFIDKLTKKEIFAITGKQTYRTPVMSSYAETIKLVQDGNYTNDHEYFQTEQEAIDKGYNPAEVISVVEEIIKQPILKKVKSLAI